MNDIKLSLSLTILVSFVILSSCTTTNQDSNTSLIGKGNNQDPISFSTGESNTQSIVTTVKPSSNQSSKSLTYSTDHGHHRVTIDFTVKTNPDDTIASVYANMTNGDHESAEFIDSFNNEINNKVVGKKKSTLSLSTVGGASDTTNAFIQVITSM